MRAIEGKHVFSKNFKRPSKIFNAEITIAFGLHFGEKMCQLLLSKTFKNKKIYVGS